MEGTVKSFIDCYQNCPCLVLEEPNQEQPDSHIRRSWYPLREVGLEKNHTLARRPVTQVNPLEGIYVDDEGNVYQLADKGETKPIAVEHLEREKMTELETLLEASLIDRKESESDADSKRVHRKARNGGRKAKPALQVVSAVSEAAGPRTTSIEASNGEVPKAPAQLNLRPAMNRCADRRVR